MLPPRGAADYSESAHPKWRVLAPVAVYTLRQPAVIGMPRTGYIHVTGVPIPPAWSGLTEEEIVAKLNAKLCAVYDDGARNVIEKRIWCGDHLLIPLVARNALRVNRQITVTWTQFKAALKHRVSGLALTESGVG